MRRGKDLRKMAQKIVIPFPVWDAIAKHNEIGQFLMDEMGAKYFPIGTPRSMEVKIVPIEKVFENETPGVPGEELVDRLRIKLWYPMGGYITLSMRGYESPHPEWGTMWVLDEYQAKWRDFPVSGQGAVACTMKVTGETCRNMENTSHWRLDENNVLDREHYIEPLKKSIIIETI